MASKEESVAEKARLRAMRLLEHMDRTEKNLRMKLCRDGYQPEVADQAIEYVKAYGYVDDKRYAYRYMRSRQGEKGRRRLFQELYQKGVSESVVQEAWEELCLDGEVEDKADRIARLIEKKVGGQTNLSAREYRRLANFLMCRGFAWEDISAVFEEKGICPSTHPDGESYG